MNGRVIAGILLLVIAAISFVLGGIPFTRQETVLDIGPIEATAETEDKFPLPPIVGVIALAGGLILLVGGAMKKT
jgi:hypothetical protein